MRALVVRGDLEGGPCPGGGLLEDEGDVAARKPASLASTLINPTAPMPSFKSLATNTPDKFKNLVGFLSLLQ